MVVMIQVQVPTLTFKSNKAFFTCPFISRQHREANSRRFVHEQSWVCIAIKEKEKVHEHNHTVPASFN
jgi:hypothetical protein